MYSLNMETRSPVLLLEVVDLSVQFDLPEGVLHAVDHLDFSLSQGECLGIVGESGSGTTRSASYSRTR
jgi:ABC-type dipeptide/oligopeptide/nickel transport system ATPase component